MALLSQFRCAVDGVDALESLRAAPLPLGLTPSPAVRSFHRDIYLDTPDRSLGGRGIVCRLRVTTDDDCLLALIIGGAADRPPERWEAPIAELDPRQALDGPSEPARRLRGLVDPHHLAPRIEIETERWTRVVAGGWLRRRPRFEFFYDICTVRHAGLVRTFEEILVRRLDEGGPRLEAVARALEDAHALRPTVHSKSERALQLMEAMAEESTARLVATDRAVAVLAFDGDDVAFVRNHDGLALPVARGSGEEACRHLLRNLFGSGVGELHLLGHTFGSGERRALEVWIGRKVRVMEDHTSSAPLEWLTLPDALLRVGTPDLRSPEALAALALAARLDQGADGRAPVPAPVLRPVLHDAPRVRPIVSHVVTDAPPDHFLNVELSQLAFHERVLELGEDPTEPLAERLRYLAIVAGNLDEFFSVRVGALKAQVADGDNRPSFDGLSPLDQLDAIAARTPALMRRLGKAARACFEQLASRGFRVRTWDDLSPPARNALTRHFEHELMPLLTPRALTLSPGHPFPIIPHLSLAFAVLVRDVHTGPVHFAYLAIPGRLPRFLAVPDSGDLIPIEEVVRANLQAFYPDRPVEQAWLFRVTRGADIDLNEEDAGDLLQAIEEDVRRRPLNAAVRIEIQTRTPPLVRDLLQRELRFERRGQGTPLGDADFYEAAGLLDLGCLRDVAARLPADDQYPAPTRRDPFAGVPSLLAAIDEGDRLVHFPFDDFDRSVGRFIEEAAADPTVVGIKVILYRVGEQSALADALALAARRGKDVTIFIELKARFDEERNAEWVKRLEEAGAQVVYGIVGLKIHAKMALVIRETPTGVRRYVHIATGNYNAGTARAYTDLGLFTADPEITADAGDVFNQLTGSTRPPTGRMRHLLVSPGGTLPGLLERIDREIDHAEAGRRARIRMQVNGLEDPEVVTALYRAAGAGVTVDLVVRGLCVLRPGVPELSDGIRVRSVVGRFLEHQRIFHFENGGLDEYFIGSADLRPRNLRRRVEVLTPVSRRDLKARLGCLLDQLLAEPLAWDLDGDGRYRRGTPSVRGLHLHARLLAET